MCYITRRCTAVGNVPHLAVQGVSKGFVLIEKKELKKGSKEFVLIENNDFYIIRSPHPYGQTLQ